MEKMMNTLRRILIAVSFTGLALNHAIGTQETHASWYAGTWDSTIYNRAEKPRTVAMRFEIRDSDSDIPVQNVQITLQGYYMEERVGRSGDDVAIPYEPQEKEFKLRAATNEDGVAVFSLGWQKEYPWRSYFGGHAPREYRNDGGYSIKDSWIRAVDDIEKIQQIEIRHPKYHYKKIPFNFRHLLEFGQDKNRQLQRPELFDKFDQAWIKEIKHKDVKFCVLNLGTEFRDFQNNKCKRPEFFEKIRTEEWGSAYQRPYNWFSKGDPPQSECGPYFVYLFDEIPIEKWTQEIEITGLAEEAKDEVRNQSSPGESTEKEWKCPACAHIYRGDAAPNFCPECGHSVRSIEARERRTDSTDEDARSTESGSPAAESETVRQQEPRLSEPDDREILHESTEQSEKLTVSKSQDDFQEYRRIAENNPLGVAVDKLTTEEIIVRWRASESIATNLSLQHHPLIVRYVLPDSSAERAGIELHDVISSLVLPDNDEKPSYERFASRARFEAILNTQIVGKTQTIVLRGWRFPTDYYEIGLALLRHEKQWEVRFDLGDIPTSKVDSDSVESQKNNTPRQLFKTVRMFLQNGKYDDIRNFIYPYANTGFADELIQWFVDNTEQVIGLLDLIDKHMDNFKPSSQEELEAIGLYGDALAEREPRLFEIVTKRPEDILVFDYFEYPFILLVKVDERLKLLFLSLGVRGKSTLLHRASHEGIIDRVNLLLQHGADIDAIDEEGRTPLLLAVAERHAEVVSLLLQQGAILTLSDEDKNSPLHIAAHSGNRKIVLLLLAKGARVNSLDDEGATPLHNAASQGALDIAKSLLSHGADITIQDKRGNTPLHNAARQGGLGITTLLLKNEADLTVKDASGYTPLYSAISNKQEDTALFLISEGSDVNAKDEQGDSVLLLALRLGLKDVANLLISKGADIKARQKDGRTALHCAIDGRLFTVAGWLLSNGADVNAVTSYGDTPFHRAAGRCTPEVARLLLENGADVTTSDRSGNTVLHDLIHAHIHNYAHLEEIVSLILNKGANVNAQNTEGNTPLHFAIREYIELWKNFGGFRGWMNWSDESAMERTVTVLLRHGASTRVRNRYGKTPMDFADDAVRRGGSASKQGGSDMRDLIQKVLREK